MKRNRLLRRLPDTEQQRLEPLLRHVKLELNETIYKARSQIDYVYFPTEGVCSTIIRTTEGRGIEVATVGNEGMVGVHAVIGNVSSFNEVVMQVPGAAWKLPAKHLLSERTCESEFLTQIITYHYFVHAQASQSVACHAIHNVRQRCCRWLLMTHDRASADRFQLTHEYLAVMLGVRRASVSEVLNPLQRKGILTSKRGTITIHDRDRLEKESCECYAVIREEYIKLFGHM